MAANEESDPSAILNGFWVTLIRFCETDSEQLMRITFPSSTLFPLFYDIQECL